MRNRECGVRNEGVLIRKHLANTSTANSTKNTRQFIDQEFSLDVLRGEVSMKDMGSEYQEEVKQKNQVLLRQHSPCVPLQRHFFRALWRPDSTITILDSQGSA